MQLDIHINNIVDRANRLLGLVKRTFSYMDGPQGVLGIWGEWLFIFRDLGSTGNYFRGAGETAHSFGDIGSPAKKQNIIKEKLPFCSIFIPRHTLVSTFRCLSVCPPVPPCSPFPIDNLSIYSQNFFKFCIHIVIGDEWYGIVNGKIRPFLMELLPFFVLEKWFLACYSFTVHDI